MLINKIRIPLGVFLDPPLLWISRPAFRKISEEEEVLEQSAVCFYSWKTCATYEPLRQNTLNPT